HDAAAYARHAASKAGGHGVVLVVHVPAGHTLTRDEKATGYSFRHAGDIPAKWIVGYARVPASGAPTAITPVTNAAGTVYYIAVVLTDDGPAANTRWRFNTDPEKVRAFRDWLRTLLRNEVTGKSDEEL